ncbi:spore coat associated protein CotJA [Clostridium culturomicium]|uniref:spore coat associated protein CotJA n=1 Tax=Clostridium culturomicium TaxID=1499683 RepID=UPI001F402505|nr:spore coat associated protein CotJA [Clostridium culturomicium]
MLKGGCVISYYNSNIKLEYARAYIIPQRYKSLYSICEGFYKGTIFRDLYRPYKNN